MKAHSKLRIVCLYIFILIFFFTYFVALTKMNQLRLLEEQYNAQTAQNYALNSSLSELEQKNKDLYLENLSLIDELTIINEKVEQLEKRNTDLEEALESGKTEVLSESEYQILAKLLYREAGGMSWDAKLYTCSSILNMRDKTGRSIYSLAHDVNVYSPAPYVDSAKPTEECYQVIDYVLQGHRVPDICYFRTDYYHNFGIPVCEVDGHYFSKPK